MIKIKQVTYSGGGCPYELEGITTTGKYFYLRYRSGVLRYQVRDTEDQFDLNYDWSKIIGNRWAGIADDELFKKELDDLVSFPDDFNFNQEFGEKQ